MSSKEPSQEQTHRNGEYDNKVKGIFAILKRQGDVHTVQTRHQGRHHQYDGHQSQALNDHIQVIGDDRSIGLHRTIQDIGIYIRHCLLYTSPSPRDS